MGNYLLAEDDGLPARTFGKWTTVKLDYLQRYIDLFEKSMRGKSWCARCYIDLYAGTGKFQLEGQCNFHLGSALLALTTKHPFTHYFFVEKSQENFDILCQRCEGATQTKKKILCGDANLRVKEIVDEIKSIEHNRLRDEWSSLNLAFLDPDGLELEWETIEKLASVRKMDLIIYYSQSGLTRNFENCISLDADTDIDRFFGDREWRNIYKTSQSSVHRKLIDHYKHKLSRLGYLDIRDVEDSLEPLMKNSKDAPLYRLIFASKHERGHEFWKKITERDLYGNKRLF